jgi:flagellar motility protein MotE (MotC chaperone)
MPTLRLIPIVLFATASLFALKAIAFLGGESVVFGGPQNANAQTVKRSWAQEMLGYPEYTGSVPKPAETEKPAEPAKPAEAPTKAEAPKPGVIPSPERIGQRGSVALGDPAGAQSAGERAVLESLQRRREELEARARELEIREGLVKAAEKRLETRLQELKEAEAQVTDATQKKDEADAERFKSLVTMYETMKAKDAARIFDRLDMRILLDVASGMNPRRLSDILAQMSPEAAERLTIELALRANASKGEGKERPVNPLDLPKIEGRPRS